MSLHQVRHIRVPISDWLSSDLAASEPVRVEEGLQGPPDQQGRLVE